MGTRDSCSLATLVFTRRRVSVVVVLRTLFFTVVYISLHNQSTGKLVSNKPVVVDIFHLQVQYRKLEGRIVSVVL